MNINIRKTLIMASAALLLAACHEKKEYTTKTSADEVKVLRFEKELFGTPIDKLQQHLVEIQGQYATPMLNLYPDDPKYMEQVYGFVQDSTMREVYDTVMAYYDNLDWLAPRLSKGINRLNKMAPSINCNKVYTFITGDFDYEHRVAAGDNTILIAIDQYTAPKFAKYGHFMLPDYMVALLDTTYLVADCMTALAKSAVPLPNTESDLTLLDFMMAEGKALFCTHVAFPDMPDSIILRYSSDQMAWAQKHVGDVWSYLVQHNLLYETEYSKFNNILDDAPKTNAFGQQSAPRMAAYIGYLILQELDENRAASLEQILNLTNSQDLLKRSGWKPVRK